MPVVDRLVGYDKRTEQLAVTVDVPARAAPQAKTIAGIAIQGKSQLGDWEPIPGNAHEIARLIAVLMDVEVDNIFVEPSALPDDATQERARGAVRTSVP